MRGLPSETPPRINRRLICSSARGLVQSRHSPKPGVESAAVDMTADHTAFAQVLSEMTDEELEDAAADYIWLAEKQASEVGRSAYIPRRNQVVAECERRGRMDLVTRARSKPSEQ